MKLYDSLVSKSGGYEFVRRFVKDYDPRVWRVAYVVSGILMISDTLAATVERGEGEGLAGSLVKEFGIGIEEIDEFPLKA